MTIQGHQLSVSALFGYPAPVHKQNTIGLNNCGQPMCHNQHCPMQRRLFQRGLNERFRLTVYAGSRFIEDQYIGGSCQGPGKG